MPLERRLGTLPASSGQESILLNNSIPGNARRAAVAVVCLMGSSACTPTVKVATDDPITINLNVNIQHEIRVKVDRELEDLFSEDSDLF